MGEAMRRRWAAVEARALGRGGETRVAEATGLSLPTIRRGLHELDGGVPLRAERQRAAGAGRPPRAIEDPKLLDDLDALVDPVTRGDPSSPLRWTCKSTLQLAQELQARGHAVSHQTVGRLLHQLDFSLQAARKTHEGAEHPDRDAQFHYIARKVRQFQRRGQPSISVDTKKKELIGEYANGGREWHPKREPTRVNVHDFKDRGLGEYAKAIPYGIYDVANDEGWVSVGDTADTAEFAVESIRRWWHQMGSTRFPEATRLLITADAGGSNGYRVRAWKHYLAELAAETGLEITVCHYPPGTSKWNKIEHRMFSFISMNWRGRPLTSIRTIVELIANTRTSTGLAIQAAYDPNWYPTGQKITKAQLAAVPLTRHDWHGDWNYTIAPEPPA
jgi:transposase